MGCGKLVGNISLCWGNDVANTQDRLPEFDNPPVSEVALSVEFIPVDGWKSPYWGLFWGKIREEYPDVQVHHPLRSQIEVFGSDFWADRPPFQVAISEADLVRFWFLSKPANRLVQVQRDRFITNWRKVTGDEAYPRYINDIRPRFVKEWERFKQFVASQKLGDLTVRQCEVTYINDIPRGEGWDSFADLMRVLSPWSGKTVGKFLPPLETLGMSGSFVMPNEQGRLHFQTQHLRRSIDDREVLQLRLTARGNPETPDDSSVMKWMDLGREWIVRGFKELTTSEAHAFWGLRS